jgi:hypothetical protein
MHAHTHTHTHTHIYIYIYTHTILHVNYWLKQNFITVTKGKLRILLLCREVLVGPVKQCDVKETVVSGHLKQQKY